MSVPRRMPPGQEQRIRVNADRAGSMRGRTRWAKPVPSRVSTSTPYTPPSTGYAIAASWDLHDSSTSGSVSTGYDAQFGGPNFGEGPFSSYFNQLSTSVIQITAEGWYELSGHALVSGSTAGDVIDMELITGLPQVCGASVPGKASSTRLLQASTAPFYLYDGAGGDVPVSLTLHVSGSGSGTVIEAHMRLVRYAGVGPL